MAACLAGGNPGAHAPAIKQRPANHRADEVGRCAIIIQGIQAPGYQTERAAYLNLGIQPGRLYANPRSRGREVALSCGNICAP
ncbi:hypothetical protein D3C79_1027410 [compost metagenome]